MFCQPTSKVRPIGRPYGMVQHNRCLPYIHVAEGNAVCASYDLMYLLVSMWTVSVLATVYAAASFCVSARLCVPGVLLTATEGNSAAPPEGRAGGQRPGLGGTPGQVAR